MMQPNKILYLFLLNLLFSSTALAGQVSMTTYYSPPKNSYDQLHLIPRSDYSGSCEIGSIYVNLSGKITYCSSPGIWGSLNGLWTQKNTRIFPNTDISTYKIGIGTSTPNQDFEIKTSNLNSGNPINWASPTRGQMDGHIVLHGNYATMALMNTNQANNKSLIKYTEVFKATDPGNPGDFINMWGWGRESTADGGGFLFGFKDNSSVYEYYDDAGLSMYINPNGNVGMGRFSSPQELLHIKNNDGITSVRLQERNNTDSIWELRAHNSPDNFSIWGGAGGSLSERLTITENGNVGIATTTPTAQLHVGGNGTILMVNSNSYVTFQEESVGEINHTMSCCNNWGGSTVFRFKSDPALDNTWNIEPMLISTNNNIGLNFPKNSGLTPSYPLHIKNQSVGIENTAPSLALNYNQTPGVGTMNWNLNTSGDNFRIQRNGYLDGGSTRTIMTVKKNTPNPEISLGSASLTNVLNFESGSYFKSDGDICSSLQCFNASTYTSDFRLKKNISNYTENSLNKFLKLNPVHFYWKDPIKMKSSQLQTGFIAQEVKRIFPEWVIEQNNQPKKLHLHTFKAHTIKSFQLLDQEIKEKTSAHQKQIIVLQKQLEKINNEIKINNEKIKNNNTIINHYIKTGKLK
ncbi:MAG: tail fiber domain-containing protein [Candidatus Omnitrophica bacterium]|nr:tail fiber domain-containing protein [Candidatus Omnitrophota bacterium]MCB9747169.1 tail fiber domain-containing protein [Candidatus Omnitrophota bacterium]